MLDYSSFKLILHCRGTIASSLLVLREGAVSWDLEINPQSSVRQILLQTLLLPSLASPAQATGGEAQALCISFATKAPINFSLFGTGSFDFMG